METINKIKQMIADGVLTQEDANKYFPELKESEDEKIKKQIIGFITYSKILDETKKNWIAWLEKQDKSNMGISEATKQELEDNLNKALEKETPESFNKFLDEQNPADKIEPKFKVGDVIRHKEQGFTCKITAVDTEYRVSDCCGSHLPFDSQDYYELVEQKPVAWSEEDERSIRDSIFYLKSAKKYFEKDDDILWNEKWFNLCIDWLKSLKERVQPQPTWKPSDEQMEALYDSIPENMFEISEREQLLESLYQDLKKL